MALLNILRYPDARLHKTAAPVTVFDEALKRLVADMAEIMYAAPGIGLAATQVDVHERVIVMDTSEQHDKALVLINPEIVAQSEEWAVNEEGCLSVPLVYDRVERPARVTVRALGRDGQPFELEAEGLTAVCVQHEMDHIEGKLFVDYLSDLKRDRVRKKLDKDRKERAKGSAL